MNTQPLVNPPKGRILAIDFLKALAIILVVFSHINAYNGSAKIWAICFPQMSFSFPMGWCAGQRFTNFLTGRISF